MFLVTRRVTLLVLKKRALHFIFGGILFHTDMKQYNFTQNEIQCMLGQIEYRKTEKARILEHLWGFSSFWIFGSI